ncbi:hypothetical protein RR48_11784 [Papilio machaon]|uniref:Uncharacterized protein n=1 Tax=Papilio machaon TaxID=76193 RepID=A0A194QMI3_PAPMA|nr:hypothetical protein RR48_11784 [Papilio machaon]
MARITRIALDFALISIKTIRPAVTRLWRGSKSYILETSMKRLVDNNLVTRAEYALHDVTENLQTKLTTLRDNQLPKEIEYLEKELQKAKEKMKNDKVC